MSETKQTKFETELAQFDPQLAELKGIAEESSKLTITDFTDKSQVAVVREKRIELKGLRVQIKKTGKSLRDEANAFNAKVLAKEKELVGVIEPEEKRLQELEDEAVKKAEIEKRKTDLPLRKVRLAEIGDEIVIEDSGILEKDDTEFDTYVNQRVANWNIKQKEILEKQRKDAEEKAAQEEAERKAKAEAEEAERRAKIEAEDAERKAKQDAEDKERAEAQAKLDADRKKLEDDKREAEHQKELEAAKKEAEEKAKAEAAERAEFEAKRKADQEAKEKEEAEAKAKAEAEALAKKQAYKKFLADAGWTPETQSDFHLEETAEKVVIYKKVSTYIK